VSGIVSVPAPTNPDIASNSSDGNLIVTWQQAAAPDNNEVWKQVNGGGFALFATVAGGATQFIDNAAMVQGATPTTTLWEYQIRAKKGGQFSAFTAAVGAIKSNDINAPANASISLPTLRFSVLIWACRNCPNITSFSATNLHDSLDHVGCYSSNLLTSVDLSNLKTSGGLQFSSDPLLASLSFPKLVTCNPGGGGFDCSSGTGITSFSAPLLASVLGSQFSFANDLSLVTISAPSITTVTNNFLVNGCTALTTLTVTSLGTVGGDFMLFGCSALASVAFNNLTDVSGNFDFSDCAVLTTVSLPALTSVTNGIVSGYFGGGSLSPSTATASPSLTTVSIPNLIFPDAMTIDFTGCNLTAASVNQILARGVASGVTTCDFELAGGTNAAPSGQGIIDKATLIGAGNTVNTN
jgi:hypothetical protein